MTRFVDPLLVLAEDVDSRPALARALRVALDNGTALTALLVTQSVPATQRAQLPAGVRSELEAALRERREAVLADALRAAGEAGVELRITCRDGPPFLAVIGEVLSGAHDLVLKTAGGSGERTFDANDKHLLRKCPCPLWLVTPSAGGRCRRILAAVDPEPGDEDRHALGVTLLEAAAGIARLDDTRLDVLHAWTLFGEHLLRSPRVPVSDPEVDQLLGNTLNRHAQMLDRLVEGVCRDGIEPSLHLVHGPPAEVIAGFVAEHGIDLLVMGTVGRSGVPGLLIGNTAEQVIDRVDCSLLAFKPPGFVTPVPAGD